MYQAYGMYVCTVWHGSEQMNFTAILHIFSVSRRMPTVLSTHRNPYKHRGAFDDVMGFRCAD